MGSKTAPSGASATTHISTQRVCLHDPRAVSTGTRRSRCTSRPWFSFLCSLVGDFGFRKRRLYTIKAVRELDGEIQSPLLRTLSPRHFQGFEPRPEAQSTLADTVPLDLSVSTFSRAAGRRFSGGDRLGQTSLGPVILRICTHEHICNNATQSASYLRS